MALSHVKVLDLSRILAGPFCTMLLGDNGADIIKVENPRTGGDDTRRWGPPFVEDDALYYWSVNRNKRSIAVDLKDKRGSDLIRDLVKHCDVIVENYLPGKLKTFQLDYESLRQIKPDIIYCSITGFGQEGPSSSRPGYDVIAAGLGGLLHITGPEDGEPCRVGVAVTDLMTGMFAYSSIVTALYNKISLVNILSGRAANYQGCLIDCNLLSTQITMLFHLGANYLTVNQSAKRWGTAHSTIVPYQAFGTSDDRLFIVGAGNDNQYNTMLDKMGFPADSPVYQFDKFSTNQFRVENRRELIGLLSEKFKSNTLAHWLDQFQNTNLPNGPVNDLKQVFNDPQVQFLANNRGLIDKWPINDGKFVSVPGNPVYINNGSINSPELPCNRPPPKLGQHTKEILREYLNKSTNEINELIDKKVIQ